MQSYYDRSNKRQSNLMKEKWMESFRKGVVGAFPAIAGKIDWNTAVFYYNEGLSWEEATKRYVKFLQNDRG